jgi:hypothetical protein
MKLKLGSRGVSKKNKTGVWEAKIRDTHLPRLVTDDGLGYTCCT